MDALAAPPAPPAKAKKRTVLELTTLAEAAAHLPPTTLAEAAAHLPPTARVLVRMDIVEPAEGERCTQRVAETNTRWQSEHVTATERERHAQAWREVVEGWAAAARERERHAQAWREVVEGWAAAAREEL